MIECHDIYSNYNTSLSRPILNGITLKINQGECVALLGLNGAGKSSLLKAMVGLLPLQKGEIYINNLVMTQKTLNRVRRQIGMIWQGGGLIPQLSALDNVLCGKLGTVSSWSSLWGFSANDRITAQSLLRQLGLEQHEKQKVSKLSGGQQQRVAIARALMESPKILFADEPTSGLDLVATQQMMNIITDLRKQGMTIVLVLHDLAMASEYTDRSIILDKGRVIYDGKSENIQHQFAHLC
ncbi:phosphonate ABC transporter ATP-binding protein [Aphanothece hegewaldii CCALA 016]|uniref:Phosphonate ABC transporter ATP-binding protein n=1 Tax=Aphanothece hegewaldii CCALA 016 TaxID=2107694 RepID=A0A2T1LSU9_9CHRO|nr:ATP-binding cassette domain-containing protein [Aphanothece hegewaldii]PSF33065.1 phosphonate ABC transporter ATP-binding protein [Aphanothece hegewaldii CCALA 016]